VGSTLVALNSEKSGFGPVDGAEDMHESLKALETHTAIEENHIAAGFDENSFDTALDGDTGHFSLKPWLFHLGQIKRNCQDSGRKIG